MVLNNKLIKELEEEAEELKKRTEERKKMIEEEQIKNIKDINYLYKLNEIIFLMKEAEAIKETKEETKKQILRITKKTKKELKEEAKKKNNLREIKEELKELYRDEPKETRKPTTDKIFFKEDAEELENIKGYIMDADEMKEYLKKNSIICIINNLSPNLKGYERGFYKSNINDEWGDNEDDKIDYNIREIFKKYNLEFKFYNHDWGYLKNNQIRTNNR
jgi:hypothetical protein